MALEMEEAKNGNQDARSSPLYQQLVSNIYASVKDGKQSPLSQGFDDVQNRRWWKRIWVLQEVVVAKSAIVICGEKSIKYSDFHVLYGALRKGADHILEEKNHLVGARKIAETFIAIS
jgi:hypothetical protein